MKEWRDVACPTCGAQIGDACVRIVRRSFFQKRDIPHVARVRLAEQPLPPRLSHD